MVRTLLIAETIRYLQKLLKPLPAWLMAAFPMHGSHKPMLKIRVERFLNKKDQNFIA
jgi:hypothetical protein